VRYGWEVVERYILGQKGYEKADTVGGRGESREGRGELYSYEETSAMPVVIIDEGRGKTHKTGHITLYTILFKGVMCASQK
jgi:hypothetical protein